MNWRIRGFIFLMSPVAAARDAAVPAHPRHPQRLHVRQQPRRARGEAEKPRRLRVLRHHLQQGVRLPCHMVS